MGGARRLLRVGAVTPTPTGALLVVCKQQIPRRKQVLFWGEDQAEVQVQLARPSF